MDHELINSAQDLYDTVEQLAWSYNSIVLTGICEKRMDEFRDIVAKKPLRCAIITDHTYNLIKNYLEENWLNNKVSVEQCISCVLRVSLDNFFAGFVKDEWNVKALDQFRLRNDPNNHDMIADHILVEELAGHYFDAKLNIRDSSQFVRNYRLYSTEKIAPDERDYSKHSNNDNSVYLHERYRGMIESQPKINITNLRDLDRILSCFALTNIQNKIKDDPEVADYLTLRHNYSAIVTNGTAVLGLGNIGGVSGMPVMEGKCVLFREFGGVNMIPICCELTDEDEVIMFVRRICPIFTSINLEDFKAPQCFKIEQDLAKICRPAIFHDDQHGTAIICVAALNNAAKVVKKEVKDIKIVINGCGAAGVSICRLLLKNGCKEIIMCDTKGAIYEGRPNNMNPVKDGIAKITNSDKKQGDLTEIIKDADLFIGVSVGGIVSQDMVKSMARDPIIMALANPVPEIWPQEAYEAGAKIVCTGRSDFANQVNNSLAFPGIFRAIREIRIESINDDMKLAAAHGISLMIDDDKITFDMVIPKALDFDVPRTVARIVREEAIKAGLVRPTPKAFADKKFRKDSIMELKG